MTQQEVLEEAMKDVDIVPYTKGDRIVAYIILTFVIVNCVGIIIGLLWGI